MARRSRYPRTLWWGRLYTTTPTQTFADVSVEWEYEWVRHFRANNLLGDLKVRVHA